MTAFLSLERKRAHALRRAKHVQIALLLPSVVGSLVLGVLSSGSFNFYDSAENILTVTVPAGATSNLYWPALMYLPILVTIFFLVSGMQAKVLVEASDREQHAREDQVKRMVTGEMNSRNSVSETSENDLLKRTSMSEQLRRVKLANVLRVPNQSAAKELTRPHPEARASLEDEEDVLRKRQERNVTPLEALHAIGLVIFVSVFLIVPSLVHSENPLFATVDVPNLIVQITTLALGIVIAFGIVWNLRLSILRHEPSGAVTRLRRLMRRSKQVIGVQFFLMMHVSVFALSLPPLLSPLAFESGYLLTAPCALVNASYLRHYCEPFLPAVHTRTDSAADAVWLQALGRTRRCVDGGWNEYVSVHNACHAACAATMLRARSYSSLFLSLNVMFNLLFTELTTDVTSQTMDQWVRVSRSGWPTKGAANIFYHLAMASCAIFLAVALMPGQGPFGLPRTAAVHDGRQLCLLGVHGRGAQHRGALLACGAPGRVRRLHQLPCQRRREHRRPSARQAQGGGTQSMVRSRLPEKGPAVAAWLHRRPHQVSGVHANPHARGAPPDDRAIPGEGGQCAHRDAPCVRDPPPQAAGRRVVWYLSRLHRPASG